MSQNIQKYPQKIIKGLHSLLNLPQGAKEKREICKKSKHRITDRYGCERERKRWMPSFILMGLTIHIRRNHFGSESGNNNNVEKYIHNRHIWEEKKLRRFSLFFFLLRTHKLKEENIFLTWILIQERKEKNFYAIKWMELNINGKFEGEIKYANLKMLLRVRKRFHIALHGFILLLPKCDYLFHIWNHHRFAANWGNSAERKKWRRKVCL